jgi:putative endonuclease
MREKRSYYVYILASFSGTLYVGVTNDIEGRMQQHKSQTIKGFTEKYGVTRLLYYEEFDDVHMAIAREKEIKKWRREKKISLFEETNPGWEDLSKEWFED